MNLSLEEDYMLGVLITFSLAQDTWPLGFIHTFGPSGKDT